MLCIGIMVLSVRSYWQGYTCDRYVNYSASDENGFYDAGFPCTISIGGGEIYIVWGHVQSQTDHPEIREGEWWVTAVPPENAAVWAEKMPVGLYRPIQAVQYGGFKWETKLFRTGPFGGDWDTLVIPSWLIVIVSSILPGRSAFRWFLVRQRRLKNRCPVCGYNLTANTSGVCPECGTAVAGKAQVTT